MLLGTGKIVRVLMEVMAGRAGLGRRVEMAIKSNSPTDRDRKTKSNELN
jgi:hypothetical protein